MKTQRKWLGLIALLAIIAFVTTFNYGGCGGGGGSKSGSSAPATTISFSGTFDGSVGYVSLPGSEKSIWDYFCDLFRPNYAYAQAGVAVDKIYAITYNQAGLVLITATKNANSFTLSLDKTNPNPYIIVFLNGTTVQGLMKLDNATGLDALPLSANSGNINMGTVSFGSGQFSGNVNQTDFLNTLGINSDLASAIGFMDEGMKRWASLDTDQNGILDFTENKIIDFGISYGFDVGQSFNDITSTNYSNHELTAFQGYRLGFNFFPADALGFDATTATATMHSPANINGTNDGEHSYNASGQSPDWGGFEFYSGDAAIDPYTPPAGTYVITVTDSAVITTNVYTFLNVSSQTIISPTLLNVYIPSIRLTVAGGQVTRLEYKWWKNTATGWVNPSSAELAAVIESVDFEFGEWDQGIGDLRVEGIIASMWDGIPFVTQGNVAVPAQAGFTASTLRISYFDKAGFGYGFEWRTNP